MKSKSPAFQFYPQDFLVGTAMLSAEETGAYIRLLCYSWTHDGLPNDDAQLMRLAGCHGNAMGSIRDKFGICQDGKLRNERQEEVRNKQKEYREAQKANSEKRWQKAQKTNSFIPSHIPRDIPSDMPSDMPSDIPRDQSGISQTHPLHSSSSIYTIDKSIVVSPSNDEPAPETKKLNDEDKTTNRKNQIIDEAWIADIKRHYPTLDVNDELRKIDAWVAVNPGRRKTRRFIINWLNRCQPELPPEPPKTETAEPEGYDFSW